MTAVKVAEATADGSPRVVTLKTERTLPGGVSVGVILSGIRCVRLRLLESVVQPSNLRRR